MISETFRCTIICLFLLALAPLTKASHLRAVEIEVIGDCNSATVEIIVTAYVNFFGTNVQFGGDDAILDFGDGTSVLVPETAYEVIEADLHVGKAQYRITHSYANYGRYKITYSEPNRNAGIINFSASENTPFFTESVILLEAGVCNSLPYLMALPIDNGCTGVAFSHNPGAIDAEADSLSFELATPKKAVTTEVTDYLFPNESTFYSRAGIDYDHANEEQDARPSFSVDPISGTLTWDAPGLPGEYALAIKVTQWKRHATTGAWYEAGYVIRDMQIIVEDCLNKRPRLDVPLTVCLIAGNTLILNIPATDADHDDIVTQVYSDLLPDTAARLRVEPANGVIQSTNPPHDTASIKIIWETSCTDVRRKPYRIVFKISDRPPEGPRLATFYTLDVKIIAPQPEYENISVNPVTKQVDVNWKDYPCQNAVAFQVWRRVSHFEYQADDCEIGMPPFLRYQLRAEMPGTSSGFTDTDLAIGSQYCYRIVALVGDERVPSVISLDTCFIPKPAEAPVIVNVSVEHTNSSKGQVLVRWTRPFDIDPDQYPPPYQYRVLRMNVPNSSPLEPVTQTITDTVFIDSQLNTAGNIYQYMVELYVPALTTEPVDTSSHASSVFAETRSGHAEITITWQANTPWYNYSQQYPYHWIYRSDSFEGPFDLIDSVDVNHSGFEYKDTGKYRDLGLTSSQYYYKVLTSGTYGNRKILEPLENFSQITRGSLLDTIPPCAVSPSIRETECAQFACDGSDYSTTLEWVATCDDVVAYEVFVKDPESEGYRKIATTSSSAFVHKNINSLNKCYRIVSLDQAGNRSDSSAAVCNSNCINFKLPNVITPGLKDHRNDYLTTFRESDNNRFDCARSVQSVRLMIFSRWGDQVYTATIGGDALIFWDGRNSHGQEVASGIYFYHADVIFDTSDVARRSQRIRGWVHVLK
jgi:hypothetical protein